jgi:hypothetical protein
METIYTPEETTHIAVIKNLLLLNDKLININSKIVIVMHIFDYILKNAIPFINRPSKFRTVVIKKCYEFKKDNPSTIELIASCDSMLTALGEPLEEPVSQELLLFINIVKRFDELKNYCQPNIEKKYNLFQKYIKENKQIRGTTLEEKIENFIINEMLKPIHSAEVVNKYQQIQDMKYLVTKQGLIFKDDIMPMYYKWDEFVKSATTNTNRFQNMKSFKKMKAFIEGHRHIFDKIISI